jgi:SAM-dependent methyltransferase
MEVENKYAVKDWDNYYATEKKIHIAPKKGFFISYDIFLHDSILEKYLSKYEGPLKNAPKICEIGCGDGKLVKKLSDKFGYEPFGIEYSKPAADKARKFGINVILADIFDKNLLTKYKNFFDIVYSYGFIEHITPPEKAIDAHLSLLKPNGYFFIQIPRFKGFNYWKVKFFRPDLLPLHNLEIMEEEKLRVICNRPDVEELFCQNYGTFKLRVPMDKKNLKYYLLKCLYLLEYLSGPLLRVLFGKRGFETKLFSPAVIFIGRKDFNYE